MKEEEIIKKIKASIERLYKYDSWLIENSLSEKSITHKLAIYVLNEFNDYDVDCEYNGNIENEGGRKRIAVVKDKLEELGLLSQREEGIKYDILQRAVYPDIIVHRRGSNKDNLCIIEVKKSNSKVSFDYDKIKLSSYTSEYYGNNLKYNMGVFVVFETGRKVGNHIIEYFINGKTESFD